MTADASKCQYIDTTLVSRIVLSGMVWILAAISRLSLSPIGWPAWGNLGSGDRRDAHRAAATRTRLDATHRTMIIVCAPRMVRLARPLSCPPTGARATATRAHTGYAYILFFIFSVKCIIFI
jgi:hypothetical protein